MYPFLEAKKPALLELLAMGMDYSKRNRPSHGVFLKYLEGELALLEDGVV